jgi:ribose transport system permease protein
VQTDSGGTPLALSVSVDTNHHGEVGTLGDDAITEFAPASRATRLRQFVSPKNVSAVYVALAFLILFAFWIPHLFYTETTLKALLTTNAVTAIAAIAFLVPFTTLNFDLTVGAMIGVSALVAPALMVNSGIPMLLAIPLTLLICASIGAFTGFLITVVRISSIITTIAMLSIIDALGSAALGGGQILGLPSAYLRLTSFQIFGIAMPFYYLLIVGLIVWYVLSHTPGGRYLYAIGGNEEATRLAGIQVRRLIFSTFVASALIAGIAGMIVSSSVGAGDYSVGDAYLFPAAAAMFFGSTQVKPGTFNVWGTVLAVYMLGIIVKGLELAGAPYWLPNVADGAALLLAVGLGNLLPRMRTALST